MKQTKQNSLVVKSNQMIEASYRLTLQEQRIILYMASKIMPDDEDFKPVRIAVKEFADILDMEAVNHTRMQQTTRDLLTRVITIKEPRSILQIGWLSSARYYNQEGVVELRFDPGLKPYLLQLKERFTKYQLVNVIRLKHSYSIRFYELLKQYETIGWRYFVLEELKEILGISQGEYRLYSHFKDKVLKPVKKEFDLKYTTRELDFTFEYEEKKEGRRVAGLRFEILKPPVQLELPGYDSTTVPDEVEKQQSADTLEAELKAMKLTKKQIAALVKGYPHEVIRRNIELVKKKTSDNEIRNIPAFLLEAVKGDYAANISQTQEHEPLRAQLITQANKCWNSCKGGCASSWSDYKDNKSSSCHYCRKFESQRMAA